ncbi:MAG: hypothetical protein GY818_02260, partial [Planctomycetaceae bacterium]|nr:hypothetical protein [Planctomycetaceae bacterium]
MAIQRPVILDFVAGLGSSPGITPSEGSNRLYIVCDIAETNANSTMTAVTIGGQAATIIHQFSSATMNFYCYYINESQIQAMSGTGIVRTGGSLSASFITTGVVLKFVDQTTPFVNVVDQGFSGTAINNTGTIPYTLDEIVDGLGILFGGNSKTTGTWSYENGYSEYQLNTDGSNMAAIFATKDSDAVAAGVASNLVNSLPGDKTCAMAIMVQPGDDNASPPPTDPGSALRLSEWESTGAVVTHTGDGGAGLTNQSDCTWSETLQNWLAVSNSSGTIFKYDTSNVYQGQITRSGNTTTDVEGMCHYQGDEYLLANENNQIWKVTIDATTTNVDLQVGSNQSYTLPARGLSNKGTEGVCVNPATGDVWAVQESDPMRIYHFVMPADKGDFAAYEWAELNGDEPFDPEIVFAGIILDQASIEFDPLTE